MSKHETILPEGWPRPRGYANGMAATGRQIFIAGQIGWDEKEELVGDDLPSQFGQALRNVRAVVEAGGAQVEDVVRLTIYCTDIAAYRRGVQDVGKAYREVFGKHFPAMALIGVAELVHPKALVEIEGTAVIPEASS